MKQIANQDFYNLTAKTSDGRQISFSAFEGKVVLIVNTATKCGFAPQFKELEMLHQKYKDKGLVIIGFPCNQFLNQEPIDDDAMRNVCELNFGVTFQLMEKCDVNGSNTHTVFKYLKSELGGLFGNGIKWNFTKFLIDKDGYPVRRFAPIVKPKNMELEILKILAR